MAKRNTKVVKDQGPVQSAGSTCEDFGKAEGCEGDKSVAYFLWGNPPITLCLACYRELIQVDAKETTAEAEAEAKAKAKTNANGILKRAKKGTVDSRQLGFDSAVPDLPKAR